MCGRPTQHGHANRCHWHAGVPPQLVTSSAPGLRGVPAAFGVPPQLGAPGLHGAPVGEADEVLPQLASGAPGLHGAPVDQASEVLPRLAPGTPGSRGVPVGHALGVPPQLATGAPGLPGAPVGQFAASQVPVMQISHFPGADLTLAPGGLGFYGAPVGASTPGAGWVDQPVRWASYPELPHTTADAHLVPDLHNWGVGPYYNDAIAAGVHARPSTWPVAPLPEVISDRCPASGVARDHVPVCPLEFAVKTFSPGDLVWYCRPSSDSSGRPQAAVIVAVHDDDGAPYFSISVEGSASVRDTEASCLHRRDSPGASLPTPAFADGGLYRSPGVGPRQSAGASGYRLSPGVAPYSPKIVNVNLDASVRGSVGGRTRFVTPSNSDAPKSYYREDKTGLRPRLHAGEDVARFIDDIAKANPATSAVLSIEPEPEAADLSAAAAMPGHAWYNRLEKVHYPQYDNPLVVYAHQCSVMIEVLALTVDSSFGMSIKSYQGKTPYELITALKLHANQHNPSVVATSLRNKIWTWERDTTKTLQENLNELEQLNESIRRLGRNTADSDDILLAFKKSIKDDEDYKTALDTASVLGYATAQELVNHLATKEIELRIGAASKHITGASVSVASTGAGDDCPACGMGHALSDCFGNPSNAKYSTLWYPARVSFYNKYQKWRTKNSSLFEAGNNTAPTPPAAGDTKTVRPDGTPRSSPQSREKRAGKPRDKLKAKGGTLSKAVKYIKTLEPADRKALAKAARATEPDSSDSSSSDDDESDEEVVNTKDVSKRSRSRTSVRRNGAGNGGLSSLFAGTFMVMGMLGAALGSTSTMPERLPREPDAYSAPGWDWSLPTESDGPAVVSKAATERLPPQRYRSTKGWSLLLSDTGATHTVVPTKAGVHEYSTCNIPISIANGSTVYATGRGFRYLQPRANPDVLIPIAVLICAAITSPILSPHSVCHNRDDRGVYQNNGNNFTAFGPRGGFSLADGSLVRTQTRHKLPWLAGRFVDPPTAVLDSIASVKNVSYYDRSTNCVIDSDGESSGLTVAAADVRWQPSESKVKPEPTDRLRGRRVSKLLYETHVRLGHCSFETAVKVLEMGGIKVSARDRRLACEICSRAKLPRRGAKKGAHLLRTPAKVFGEVLHLDLLEMCMSRHGRKFALVIVDDFSGWLTTIPIARKSDTARAFKEYLDNHALGRSPHEVIAHQIHSDNDAVFRGKEFHALCNSRGARQTFSAPYHANGNSRAEQGVKRAKAVCYSLLQDGKLKGGLWEEAMVHGVNVLNRLPTSFNPDEASSLEMLIGAQAGRTEGLHFLDQCLPWGVELDILRSDPKSGNRSRHGIYLGTNPHNHSARVLCEDTGRVNESVDYRVHWYDHEGVSRYDRSRPLGDMMIAPEPLKSERHHGLLPASTSAQSTGTFTTAPTTTAAGTTRASRVTNPGAPTAPVPPTQSEVPQPRRVARLRRPTTRSKPPRLQEGTRTSSPLRTPSAVPIATTPCRTPVQPAASAVSSDPPTRSDDVTTSRTSMTSDPGQINSSAPGVTDTDRAGDHDEVPAAPSPPAGDPGQLDVDDPALADETSTHDSDGAVSGPQTITPTAPGVPVSDETIYVPALSGPAEDIATALSLSAPPGITVDGFYPGDHVLFRTGHADQGTSGHIVGTVDADSTSVLLAHGAVVCASTDQLRYLGPDVPIMALPLEPNREAVAYSAREAAATSEVQHEYLQTAAEYSGNDPWRDRSPYHVSSTVLEDGTVAGGVLPINGLVSRYSAVCSKATSVRNRIRSTLGMVVPRTWAEAMAQPEAEDWREANATEMRSHHKMQTFRLRPRGEMPRRCRAVKLKPVFRIKTLKDNTLDKFRLRWVYPGYRAVPGRNVFETYTPTLHLSTFRTLLAYWVPRGLHSRHLDLSAAFLHAPLEEEFYAEPPPYLDGENEYLPESVAEIRKSLYGIPQSSRNLYGVLKTWFNSVGLKTSTADPAFFYGEYHGVFITIGLYCDDIAIMTETGNEAIVDAFLTDMQTKFDVNDVGQLDYFLGFGITHMPDGSVYLDQSKAAEELLQSQSFVGSGSRTGPNTPLPPSVNLSTPPTPEETAEASNLPFRQVVGSLLWLVQGSRPSLAFAGGVLCRRMSSWGKTHWDAASAALRHLRGHRDLGIYFPRHPRTRDTLSGWSDSSHQDDKASGRSTGGHVVYLNGAPIAWKSALSKVVCGSTAYSEFCSIAEGIKEIRVAAKICVELGIPQSNVRLYNDNKPAVLACSNEIPTGLHRHVAGRFFYAREACLPTADGPAEIDLTWISTDAMIADIFTKSLDGKTFLRHRESLEQPLPPSAVTLPEAS